MSLRETWRSRYFQVLAVVATALFQAYYFLCVQYEHLIAIHSASFGINHTVFFFGNIPTLLFALAQIAVIVVVLARFNRIKEISELFSFAFRNVAFTSAQVFTAAISVFSIVFLNVILLFACTFIADVVDVAYGSVPTLIPVINLLVVDLPVTLLFWSSLALLIAFIVRNAGIAFVIASISVLAIWVTAQLLPLNWLPLVSSYSYGTMVVSDLAPRLPDLGILLNRVATLLAATGLCAMAAYSWSRLDVKTYQYFWAGFLTLILSVLVTAFQVQKISLDNDERQVWTLAHAPFNSNEIVELTALTGDVLIRLGKRLELNLNLTLAMPADFSAPELVFSFNPGMAIQYLAVDDVARDFAFEHGILSVPCNSDPCELRSNVTLSIEAEGVPNLHFGYLEPEIDYLRTTGSSSHLRKLLGTRNSVFNKQFVALLPGIRWYPTPGPLSVDKHVEALLRAPDLFDVDLKLSVPEKDWIVAGPGHRTPDLSAKSSFKFQTNHEVTHFGIVASDFVSKIATVDELEIEFLVHRRHVNALKTLDILEDELKSYLVEWMQKLAALDISLRDSSVTLVEVPNYLRIVGGYGMDFVHSIPGIVLIKEHSLPLSTIVVMAKAFQRLAEPDESVSQLLFPNLLRYNRQNAVGGNLETAFASQLHPYTYREFTTDRAALNYLRRMSITAAFNRGGFRFIDVELLDRFAPLMKANPLLTLDRMLDLYLTHSPTSLSTGMLNYLRMSQSRETANVTALSELDLSNAMLESRRTLYFRTWDVYLAMVALHGEAVVHSMLAPLDYGDGSISDKDGIEYIYRAAEASDVSLGPFVRDWLSTDELPSFRISEVELNRISVEESDVGYRTNFNLRNDSDTDGVIRLNLQTEGRRQLDPVAVEVPTRTSLGFNIYSVERPTWVWVATYHSLNTTGISRIVDAPLNDRVEHRIRPTVEASTWMPNDGDYIVVDNLDAGTKVMSVSNDALTFTQSVHGLLDLVPDLPRIMRNGVEYSLPNAAPFREKHWSYRVAWTMYGKYVQSAFETNGESAPTVRFSTDLPESGKWSLDYYFPYRYPYWTQYGRYNFVLRDESGEFEIDIDANSLHGWNHLGTFDMEGTEVHLDLVSVDPPGSLRAADAIRWQQVE